MVQIFKIVLIITVGILAAGIAFLIYANLANLVETSRVEAAIKRDCQVDLEVNPREIWEPGIVFKDYEINGTPMRLIRMGANYWSCTCGASTVTPTPTQ